MPAVQTTYGTSIAPAVVGMVANQEPQTSITRLCQDAGGIAAGIACYRGTAANQATATPSAKWLGISKLDIVADNNTTPGTVQQGRNMAIMQKGVIWVAAAVAVAHGDPVYVTPAGLFTNVSNSSANFLVPNAEYDSATAGAALVKVRLK